MFGRAIGATIGACAVFLAPALSVADEKDAAFIRTVNIARYEIVECGTYYAGVSLVD